LERIRIEPVSASVCSPSSSPVVEKPTIFTRGRMSRRAPSRLCLGELRHALVELDSLVFSRRRYSRLPRRRACTVCAGGPVLKTPVFILQTAELG
jgi:hypothetical protein